MVKEVSDKFKADLSNFEVITSKNDSHQLFHTY